MDTETALQFLHDHQPMPDQPDQALMKRFQTVLLFFSDQPDPRCIPLLINAFGLFDDIHLYETLNQILRRFEPETVVPHIVEACRSHYPSVRFAAADVATHFPHPDLIEPLSELAREGAVLIRLTSIVALERIGGPAVHALARERLPLESDGEIRGILEDILGG